MPCDAQTFPGVTSDVHRRLTSAAAAKGYVLNNPLNGMLVADGCSFSWAWDADKETLTVTCLKKPFFISCDTVDGHIKSLISEAMGA
jgi:hypothetical protein